MVSVSRNRPIGFDTVASAPVLFPDDTLFCQRILRQAGAYDGTLDGLRGDGTRAGIEAFLRQYEAIKAELGSFDDRSESVLRTLLPKTQRAARLFLKKANNALNGFDVKMLSGSRTYAEQDKLYAKGRTAPGSVVTNARGGASNHNFGIAFDVGIFQGGRYLTGDNAAEERLYRQLGPHANPGLEWGGNWVSFTDLPHYQLPTGLTTRQVRERFEAGRAYV